MTASPDPHALDADLLAAHARDDRISLVGLYAQAADWADTPTATGFFLTQAWIFALEAGDPRAPGLHARLIAMGRDRAPA